MKAHRKLTPLKVPSQERSRHTVEAILQAATYILVERGYGALTTNGIARRAGVNIATLYQYFPNKEAVFLELARRHVVETRAAVAAVSARPARGLEATIRASIEATIAAHKVAPALHRIFTEELPRIGFGPIDAPSEEAMRRAESAWSDDVASATEEPELAMWIAMTVVHATVHRAIVERPDDLQRAVFVDELVRLVTRYLRPRRSRRVRDKA